MKAKECDCPYPISYTRIIEWLYSSHDAYDSAVDWRNELIRFLRIEFNIEEGK